MQDVHPKAKKKKRQRKKPTFIQCGSLGEGAAERGYTFAPVAIYDGFIPVEIVPQAKLFALVRKILV